MDIFLNVADGDLMLRETLHSLDEADMLMMDMMRCWKRGDEACLEKILFEAESTFAIHEPVNVTFANLAK